MILEGNGTASFTDAVASLAAEQLVGLDAQATELEGQLQAVNVQRRAIRSVLKAMEPKQTKAPKSDGSKRPSDRIGKERFAAIEAWVRAQDVDFDFTSKVLMETFEVGSDVCTDVFRLLRENGVLRLAGTLPVAGAPRLYKLLPEARSEVSSGV